MHKTQLH